MADKKKINRDYKLQKYPLQARDLYIDPCMLAALEELAHKDIHNLNRIIFIFTFILAPYN